MLTLHGTRYYLIYENTGIQDWIMLSLVPVSVVNASMDTLWHRTVEIVTAIACLLMVLLIALIASLCSYGIDSLEKKICPWRREIM